jgi:CRISPR/Cas system CSM-associated protein Csm2 small subunit
MASSPIQISIPSPPIGYYNKKITNKDNATKGNNNSYSDLEENLKNTCEKPYSGEETWNDAANSNSLYKKDDFELLKQQNIIDPSIPSDKINNLDIPYYLAKSGTLLNSTIVKPLNNQITNAIDTNKENAAKSISNQIQYLTCQLEKERNRQYDPSQFKSISKPQSIKEIFKEYPNIKIPLILVFILSMYLFVSGFFGSMDLATNIFSLIDKEIKFTYPYWGGLLIGLALPVIVLCVVYSKIVCKNLDDLDKLDITNDPTGVKVNDKPSDSPILRNFDLLTLCLFVLLLYAFVAALFTIKKKFMNIYLYTSIIGFILFIIALFIYLLFTFVPFFNTSDGKQISRSNQPRELRLFIDQNETPSNIDSNSDDDKNTRKTFFISFVFIIILGLLFFVFKSFRQISFINGILSSSAILTLPVLWVFNFVLACNYFYVYPIFLIMFRFIRYALMSVIYIMASKDGSKLRDNMSEEMLEKIDNFKNYSPSWGLVGIDELKILLSIYGIENTFSKEIIPNNVNANNISNNKFVSTGFLSFGVNFIGSNDSSNIKGIIFSVICFIITIIISCSILFGTAKV